MIRVSIGQSVIVAKDAHKGGEYVPKIQQELGCHSEVIRLACLVEFDGHVGVVCNECSEKTHSHVVARIEHHSDEGVGAKYERRG